MVVSFGVGGPAKTIKEAERMRCSAQPLLEQPAVHRGGNGMQRQLAGEGEDFVEDTRDHLGGLRLVPSSPACATAAALA
jgi:hypothetical protein